MHRTATLSIGRVKNLSEQPGPQFLMRFMREHGRQPTTLEAFEGGQRHERTQPVRPTRAALARLSANERDRLYEELEWFESRLKGRGGIFAVDYLMAQLLSMELEEALESEQG